ERVACVVEAGAQPGQPLVAHQHEVALLGLMAGCGGGGGGRAVLGGGEGGGPPGVARRQPSGGERARTAPPSRVGGKRPGFWQEERPWNGLTLNAVLIWTIEGEPDEARDMFRFEVCNRSRRAAEVAVSGRKDSSSERYVVEGWWRVEPGTCNTIGGRYARGAFYATARALPNRLQGRGWRGNDAKLCVETSGSFERVETPDFSCKEAERESFKKFVVTGPREEWILSAER